MEFSLRDLIYLSVYVATIAGFLTRTKSKITQLQQSIDSIKNILFLEKGGLNIVDNAKCKEHQDIVFEAIRREADVTRDALAQIRYMNMNLTRLMIHMKIEPVPTPHRMEGFHMEPPK